MRRVEVLWQSVRSVPGLLRDLVVVAACLTVALVCTTYMLSKQGMHSPLSDRFEFSAEFDLAPGVRPEAQQEVRIAGVRVGRIVAAEPVKGGNARITMSLDEGNQVFENARLVLRAKSPLNPMYITLDPGGPPAAPLREDGVIPVEQTQRAIQSFELLDHLDGRVQGAITSLLNNLDVATAHAPRDLRQGLERTRSAAVAYGPVLRKLADRQRLIRDLVGDFSVVANAVGNNNNRLATLTDSMNRVLSTLADRDEKLEATLRRLPEFVGVLDHAMTGTHKLTRQLDPTLQNLIAASETLPTALSGLSQTVEDAGHLADVATPVLRDARPVVADLRSFAPDLNDALADLVPIGSYLPSATASILPWMDDLAAFVYQTSSAFSIQDANGGMGRANVNVDLTNPAGGLADQGIDTSRSPQ